RNARHVGEQILPAGVALALGTRGEHRADGTQRGVEQGLGWPCGQPGLQLLVGGRVQLDAARARRFDDQIALATRDVAFGPCHLHERHEVQQRDGLGRVAQLLQVGEQLLVGHAGALAQLGARRLGGRLLAHLRDEFLFLAVEIFLFEGASALLEGVFVAHVSVSPLRATIPGLPGPLAYTTTLHRGCRMRRTTLIRPVWLTTVALLAGLAGQPAPALAQAARDGVPPLLDRELFFGNPEIAGAQISPDGRYLAFIKPYEETRNVWVKKIGEPFESATLVTAETERPIQGYFWSHDSRYILFVQDNAGDENFNVFAVDPSAEPIEGRPAPTARNLTAAEGVRAFIYDLPRDDPDTLFVGLNDRDAAW